MNYLQLFNMFDLISDPKTKQLAIENKRYMTPDIIIQVLITKFIKLSL